MMATIPRGALAAVLMALGLQAAFWWQTRDLQAGWEGVPPAPSTEVARALAMGDSQFLYRAATFVLQNMGDDGGKTTPLKDYDYHRLGQWFFLLDRFDPESEFLPVLVGYYYSQSQNPDDVRIVISYLAHIAIRDPERNWRWLAHAIYLARYKVKDMNLALSLAYRIAALKSPGVPLWAQQMPAFVLAAVGKKEAARDLMEAILDSQEDLEPAEVDFMRNFIETRWTGPQLNRTA
jgi:hypothetical protein